MALSNNITFFHLLQSAGVLLAICIFFYFFGHVVTSRKLSYPPGPPATTMLFGNKDSLANKKSWITYAEWGKIYGDVIHFQIFGQHTIILNSIEAVKDLIEKRPHIYSDRPDVTMLKLMEWDFATGFTPYGPIWRIHRRLHNQMFRPAAIIKYKTTQTKFIHEFLHALLTSPENFREHSKNVPGGIIMSAMYGYDISPKDDYFVSLAETGLTHVSKSIFPGAMIANALPVVRHIPSWFPGARFKRFAEEAKLVTRQMRDVPFEFVRQGMAEGSGTSCIVSELLTKLDKSFLDSHMQSVKDMAATAYAAAADTTDSSILTFFYAMALYPDVQKRAQEEIDSIIGSERLVTFDDRISLPYIEAVYREVMRWQPVTPLGLPHSTSEDDIYKGFHIPKGATVFANIWALSHDQEKYENPEAFHPDRYLDDHGKLLSGDDIYAYGFGRRICPGRYLASSTLWLTIAAMLSVFDIKKKRDASGNYVPLNVDYSDGLVSHPSPFECLISPRSEQAAKLIKENS